MAEHSLIGIHGLRNKPEPALLKDWWLRAMREGLQRNVGRTPAVLPMTLTYWADVMYDQPVAERDDKEPYFPAPGAGPFPRHARSLEQVGKWATKEVTGKLLDRLSSAPVATELVERKLETKAPDLHRYYEEPGTADMVRARLAEALRSAGRQARPILLVAHSMGTIIAYDTLRELEGAVRVSHFITLGSPLGFDMVKRHAKAHRAPLAVPENVDRWTNLADRNDRVCWDSLLATDYAPSARGVPVNDWLVSNAYVAPNGEANPHKIYGYLRTPEFSLLLDHHLRGGGA